MNSLLPKKILEDGNKKALTLEDLLIKVGDLVSTIMKRLKCSCALSLSNVFADILCFWQSFIRILWQAMTKMLRLQFRKFCIACEKPHRESIKPLMILSQEPKCNDPGSCKIYFSFLMMWYVL